MSQGIACLLEDDTMQARMIASELDALNRERREIETGMKAQAEQVLEKMSLTEGDIPAALVVYQADFHQGVIGIVAGRLKEKYLKPVIAFAHQDDTTIKGSARAIPGVHIRDVLDEVNTRFPGVIDKFGGHAAAAGLTICVENFEPFCAAFEQAAQTLMTPADLTQVIETDGDLEPSELNMQLAEMLSQQVWGQGFPQPAFNACFYVENQRVVGEKHLKLKLVKLDSGDKKNNQQSDIIYDAILFFYNDPLPDIIDAVYRLQINEFNGRTTLQFLLDYWSPHDNSKNAT